jgi:Ca2+-binding RTX toxin-like protein
MAKGRLLVAIGTCLTAMVWVASANASTFTSSTPITIPAGAPSATQGAASPYPSTIAVSDVPGNVADVNVTLNGLSHTCMSDLRFLLVGPGGQDTILLSSAGSWINCDPDIVNGTITLDDEAASNYPCDAAPSGTFKPTAEPTTPTGHCSGLPVDFTPPAPAGSYPVALSALDAHPASGTWSLFVFDQYPEDSGSLSSWSLDLTAGACAGKAPTSGAQVGTGGADNLVGTPGPDVLIGNGGNDTIHGLGGNDVICGGAGNDKLFGGPGKDLIRGEAGTDKLKGQGGKDTCVGGKGKDTAKACEKDKSI